MALGDLEVKFFPHHSTESAERLGLKPDMWRIEITKEITCAEFWRDESREGHMQKIVFVATAKTKRTLKAYAKDAGYL